VVGRVGVRVRWSVGPALAFAFSSTSTACRTVLWSTYDALHGWPDVTSSKTGLGYNHGDKRVTSDAQQTQTRGCAYPFAATPT
jgi:hypothetical protein